MDPHQIERKDRPHQSDAEIADPQHWLGLAGKISPVRCGHLSSASYLYTV
jgi:hypothetical protein